MDVTLETKNFAVMRPCPETVCWDEKLHCLTRTIHSGDTPSLSGSTELKEQTFDGTFDPCFLLAVTVNRKHVYFSVFINEH
jgi:uncharacterized ParB-like nuclease family protein